MLVVAERLNCTRKRIRQAVLDKNAEFVRGEAQRQAAAGAAYIDVNSATGVDSEVADMKWMIEQVRAVSALPISVDTANPEAMRVGLELHGPGQPMLNSITGESERLKIMLPLVAAFHTKVVALAMDDTGMPETVEARFVAIEKILAAAGRLGVPRENIYIDPLIRPISTNPTHALDCLETVRRIKAEFGPLQTTGGLSNVSYGLPKRNLINRVFIPYMIHAGIDAAIIDPLEPGIMAAIYAAEAILNRDEYCMNYITADREGRLGL